LQLWLEADVGVTTNASGGVISWADQSSNHFIAAPPADATPPVYMTSEAALNNKPSVQFNTGQWVELQSPLDIIGDMSAFVVVDAYPPAGNYRGIISQETNLCAAPNSWMIFNNGESSLTRGNGLGGVYPSDADLLFGNGPVPLGQYVVLGWTFSNTGYSGAMFLDNYMDGTNANTGTIQPAGFGMPMKIGARYPGGSGLDGEIAELLLYGASLDPSDVTAVWSYLSAKYNIQYSPPTVSITSPANGATFAAPATVTVNVAATAHGNTYPTVTLYANNGQVAAAGAPPYNFPLIFTTRGSVTLTAVASDNFDITASNTVSLTITGPAVPYTPGTNLQLWLEADAGVETNSDGTVNSWNDQSGNNNNAGPGSAGNEPTLVPGAINGQPAVHMLGSNDEYLVVPYSSGLDITNDIATVIVLEYPSGFPSSSCWPFPWFNGGACGIASPNGLCFSPNGQVGLGRGTGCATRTQNFVLGVKGVQAGQVAMFAFSQAGQTVNQWFNGIPNGTATYTVKPFDGDGNSPLYIGTRGDFYDIVENDTEIAELMIFNTALSGTNLTNVQNYLLAKYGIALVSEAPIPAPTAAITSPASGGTIAAPANLTVTVSAAASAVTAVANVQLYVNGSLIGAVASAPYQFTVRITSPGEVVLTAIVTDNLGATNISGSVTLTATGAAAPSSPVTSGLQLWLKADAGVSTNSSGTVTNWADQSGNGNDAAQDDSTNAPLLVTNEVNGKPVLRFEGSPIYMTVQPSASINTLAGDVTTFAVIRIDDYSVRQALWNETDPGTDIPGPNDWWIDPTGSPIVYRGDSLGMVGHTDLSTWVGQPLTFVPTTAPSAFFILGWVAPNSDQALIFLFNDQTNAAIYYSYTSVPAEVGNPLMIGTCGDHVSEQLKGDMAELLIYDRALSSTEVATVEDYLARKYGIAFNQLVLAGPAPSLSVARQTNGSLVISWPQSYSGYILQSASSLSSGSWGAVSGVVSNQVVITPAGGQQFYRLRLP
jgi:hypothetical protein